MNALWPARGDLLKMASALAQQPSTARLLVGVMSDHLNDRDLAEVVRVVVMSFREAPALEQSANQVVARLEAERPQFFDPNRPGE